jgi:hypothetical protein
MLPEAGGHRMRVEFPQGNIVEGGSDAWFLFS